MEVTIVHWDRAVGTKKSSHPGVQEFHEKFYDSFTEECRQGNIPVAVTAEEVDVVASLIKDRQRSRYKSCSAERPSSLPEPQPFSESVMEL